MITLYRNADCSFCDEIEEAFQDIVIAYKIGNNEELRETQLAGLPLILENKIQVSGKRAIQDYIRELKQVMAQWQKFQSDSCYLDDDGKVC